MPNIPGTNVPAITFDLARGFVAPAAPLVLTGLRADWNAAFQKTLNYQLTTPQGQITSSEAALVNNFNGLFVYYTTQVDPAYATGRMQDGIARIYFLDRLPALPTALQLSCSGLPGLVIAEGARVQDAAGNIYVSIADGTIAPNGLVTIEFDAVNSGPTAVPTSVSIYQAVPGWDSAAVLSGVVGRAVETRQAFEERRAATVAGNSFGAAGSIAGAVAKVSGVSDFYVYDNATSSPVVVQGQTIAANSIYTCVSGGTDQDVAQAILSKKSAGAPYTGSTVVTAYDSNPLYSAPIAYVVKFQRPTNVQIIFTVTISNNALVPADAAAQIAAAVVNAFAGGDEGPRARIGGKILASRFYAPVAVLGPWAQIVSIQIGSEAAPAAVVTASFATTVMTVSAVTSGAIAVGQTIVAAGVLPGTRVLSFGTGGGGTGTYNLTQTQATILGESTKAVLPTLDAIVVDINKLPVIDASNVTTVLA